MNEEGENRKKYRKLEKGETDLNEKEEGMAKEDKGKIERE